MVPDSPSPPPRPPERSTVLRPRIGLGARSTGTPGVERGLDLIAISGQNLPMTIRLALIAAMGVALPGCFGEGVEPRTTASAYANHAELKGLSIGAEFLVHSFSGRGKTFVVDDYLVVEVAVFPAAGKRVLVNAGNFSLRVNGKKAALMPQTPGMVAASLKYPDWQAKPRIEAGAGVGDIGVLVGRPTARERFPGDPRPRQSRLPAPPQAPPPEDRTGVEKPEPVQADEVVVDTALPEGERTQAAAGHLYFAYRGKTKSIRSVELVYSGPEGPASLRLR